MRKIAKITENDRKALFHNTAAKMGMTDAIIEKDFWVCYVLDYLFHHSQWKDNIAFKGGTSLSKAYSFFIGAIQSTVFKHICFRFICNFNQWTSLLC